MLVTSILQNHCCELVIGRAPKPHFSKLICDGAVNICCRSACHCSTDHTNFSCLFIEGNQPIHHPSVNALAVHQLVSLCLSRLGKCRLSLRQFFTLKRPVTLLLPLSSLIQSPHPFSYPQSDARVTLRPKQLNVRHEWLRLCWYIGNCEGK